MMTISLISATPSTRAEISTSKYARQTTSATPISASQSQLTWMPAYCSHFCCANDEKPPSSATPKIA